MDDQLLPVYVLTVEDANGFVLTRPSTSRRTIISACVLCMSHVAEKGAMGWKVAIQQGYLTDAEIKANIEGFDEQIENLLHGRIDTAPDCSDMLNEIQMMLAEEATSDPDVGGAG